MTIFNIYSSQLGEQQFNAIAQAIGSTRDQAILGSAQIVPILVSAMARITREESGAKALSDKLDRNDGSILAQLGSLYANPALGHGDEAIAEILGNKRALAEQLVSQESGLNAASAAKLFTITTPIVLAMIAMKKRQDKVNASLLAKMLNDMAEIHERAENPEAEEAAPAAGGFMGMIGNIGGMLKSGNFKGIGNMVKGLLDKNKDGDIMDDLKGMAGGLFGGKK
jgi:hypothetical protein